LLGRAKAKPTMQNKKLMGWILWKLKKTWVVKKKCHKKSEKTAYKIRENTCKLHIW
jgi:hypothetical protein